MLLRIVSRLLQEETEIVIMQRNVQYLIGNRDVFRQNVKVRVRGEIWQFVF